MGNRVVTRLFIKITSCLITFLLGNFLFAQTSIEGVVYDSQNNPIPSISVLASKINSDTIVAYTYTNGKGEFTLNIKKIGWYELTFDGLAHTKKSIKIEVGNQREIKMDLVFLDDEETLLDEVIILAERPITIKKDTIIFDVAAFSRGNEVVVEDLLKNIPGISVDANGKITIQGKEVEKVMVNYDDFFDKGYTILTKNMPSHTIDKVEVLEHYSNNRLLKGIEDSEKVALNLTLKENKKNIWFGDLTLGHDITGVNEYETNANIMSFGDKNKYYFLTSLNNTGVDVSGDISYVVSPNRFSEPGTLGNDQKATSMLNLTGNNLGLKQERINFNNVEFLSLNSIFNVSSKTKFKVLGLLKTDNNDFYRNGFETFFLNDQTFSNTEDYALRSNSLTGFGQLDITHNISSKSMLEYIGKFSQTKEDIKTKLYFNEELTTEFLEQRNHLIDHKAVYSNKFKENNVLVFTGRFMDDQKPQNYRVNQFFFEDLFTEIGEVNDISQLSKNKMQFVGIEGHLLSKSENGNLLELKAGYTYRKDNLTSQLFLRDENGVIAPENYSNNTIYETNDLYFTSKYIRKFNKLSVIGDLGFHKFYNRLTFKGEESSTISPFFITPKLQLEWRLNSKNKFFTSYSYNVINAGILDLHNNFILTGYRSFANGTGVMNQTDASSLNIGYKLGNWDNLFSATTSLFYSNSHNYFSNNLFINPNFTLDSKILIKNKEMLIGDVYIEKYFPKYSTNVKLNLSFVKSEYENIVNQQSRNVQFENYNYGLEFRSGFSGMFNFNFGTNWMYNKITSGIETSFTDNVSFLTLNFMANERLNFEIEAERYLYGNLSKNEDEYYFLDFNAKYSLIKDKLSFSLQGRNIFNTDTFRRFSLTDISITRTEYKLLPRYVLLKATYRF